METIRFDVRAALLAAEALSRKLSRDERKAAEAFAVGYAPVELPALESRFK
jgi:hypothetical protein